MMIPEATRLQIQAVAVHEGGPFHGRSCYVIDGQDGIWRRVSREGRQGLRVGEGHMLAVVGKSLVELARWTEVEDVLRPFLGVAPY